jgi:hypothetical protein
VSSGFRGWGSGKGRSKIPVARCLAAASLPPSPRTTGRPQRLFRGPPMNDVVAAAFELADVGEQAA